MGEDLFFCSAVGKFSRISPQNVPNSPPPNLDILQFYGMHLLYPVEPPGGFAIVNCIYFYFLSPSLSLFLASVWLNEGMKVLI